MSCVLESGLSERAQELAMHDALSNRGAVNYDPYTAEQQYEMQQVRARFLSFFR